MEERGKVFKYKLDFYYQQALIYLVTLILYTGIRGNFIEDRFAFVFRDPILYIIILFVLVSFVALILNRIRDRKLIVTENRIIFKNRFEEHVIQLDDIDWVRIGRERRVQTGGRFQVIQMRLKRRFRVVRIRVGRYDHEKELIQEMQRISSLRPPPSHTGRRKIGTRRAAAQRHTLRT
ncbi:MAG: hypothetical protein WBW16_05420 [Bacteroidota bacterium]